MVDKDSVRGYFPRYQERWRLMREQVGERHIGFHASYLDTHLLVGIVPLDERELFAANMYAHGLLAQVFHTFVRPPEFQYPLTDAAQNTFPAVCGLLSTAWSYICPAVMPSMLLYWSEDLVLDGLSFRDRDREQRLWTEREDIFDAGSQVITAKIVPPTQLLTGRDDWDWETLFLRFFTEHSHLKAKVQSRDDTGRVVNRQP